MKSFTNKDKGEIFRSLVTKSAYQVGLDYGLEAHYKSKWSVITFIRKVEKEVRGNPGKFGVSQEIMEMVDKSLFERKSHRVETVGQGLVESPELTLSDLNIKDLIERGTKKSLLLLNKKLEIIGKSKSQLNKESAASLAKVVGILFDKRQISMGEATENIALKAKIDVKNLTQEEMLKTIIQMREDNASTESSV